MNFTNTGKEPILFIQCGWGEPICEPRWTKDPIPPGKTTPVLYRCHMHYYVATYNKTAYIQTTAGNCRISFKGKSTPQPRLAREQHFRDSSVFEIENRGELTHHISLLENIAPLKIKWHLRNGESTDSLPARQTLYVVITGFGIRENWIKETFIDIGEKRIRLPLDVKRKEE